MRSWSLILLLLGCASCIVRVQQPPGVRVSVNTNATVRANARVEAPPPPSSRVTVTVQTQTQPPPPPRPPEPPGPPPPPPPPPEPVALQGAPVVEFFGIPLEGAQDVVFVLDCSGSMLDVAPGALAQLKSQDAPATAVPTKIEVARAELADAIQRLPAGTLLNVIFFNNGVGAFAASMIALEEGGRETLVGFVRELGATGRTALAPAMRTAFLMNARRIVLLSDGLGNVGGGSDDLLRDAREAMRGGIRIDTIGLGSDQDVALLRTLAGESGGLYQPL